VFVDSADEAIGISGGFQIDRIPPDWIKAALRRIYGYSVNNTRSPGATMAPTVIVLAVLVPFITKKVLSAL
jgi:hypothetical protein